MGNTCSDHNSMKNGTAIPKWVVNLVHNTHYVVFNVLDNDNSTKCDELLNIINNYYRSNQASIYLSVKY